MLFLDSIAERGCDLFRATCERDIEGIVAKWASGAYRSDGRTKSWLKIKKPAVQPDRRPARVVRSLED